MRALALLIGNAAYAKPNDLNNAANDARDFGVALNKLGFVVKAYQDSTILEMDEAVTEFGNELENFDIGLFFYAGHGFQDGGENYLTAVDTVFHPTSAKRTSLDLRQVLGYMERVENTMNIIILDACREGIESFGKRRGLSTESLAPVFAPRGTIIAFSTSPGQSSSDGKATDGNGVYTRALLAHIMTENLTIEEFFKRVRNSVYQFTDETQITWEHTSLTSNFTFNTGQFTQASTGKYAQFAIADGQYDGQGDEKLSQIIHELKIRNYYEQGPALRRFLREDVSKADPNLLFIIGRSILSAAEGSEYQAKDFIENLSSKALNYQTTKGNPLLEGILFEIYFTKDGLLREDKKTTFLDQIMALKNDRRFKKSFDFITNELKPFEKQLFYIPTESETGKSVDIFLEEIKYKNSWKDEDEDLETLYRVKNITYEGRGIIKEDEESSRFRHHEELTFLRFKSKMAELLGIPLKSLVVHTNIPLKNDDPIQFTWGIKLRRM